MQVLTRMSILWIAPCCTLLHLFALLHPIKVHSEPFSWQKSPGVLSHAHSGLHWLLHYSELVYRLILN